MGIAFKEACPKKLSDQCNFAQETASTNHSDVALGTKRRDEQRMKLLFVASKNNLAW